MSDARWQNELLDRLKDGQVEEVANTISEKRRREHGDALLPATAYANRAKALLLLSYADLQLSSTQRACVGPSLALSELLAEKPIEVGRRLLDATGGAFRCDTMTEWLRHDPCGDYAMEFACDDEIIASPLAMAELYAHTRLSEASNSAQLQLLMTSRIGQGIKTTRDDNCRLCCAPKTNYNWGELHELPKLPRHWGCRCMYLIW